jgi:hypothetical protein
MTVSEAGALAGSDSPVRAYASCIDGAAEAGPVARVRVLLLEERPRSREDLEAALPIAVRWEGEPCAHDTCALPVARLDGDRLLLTRRDYDPDRSAREVAALACGAVRDGAVEARVRVETDGIAIRELYADDQGAEIHARHRGHASAARERFDWAELGLRLVDLEISREAASRAAESVRVRRVSELDLSSEATIELQISARERRLARDPSDERLGELAELLTRAYAAHPSRTDLGVRALERSIEARRIDDAHATLDLLGSLVGSTQDPLPRLRLALALSEGDVDSASRVIAESASVPPSASRAIAARLLVERGGDPIDESAGITLAHAASGLVAIARRETLRPRAGHARLTLRGVPAALAVSTDCDAPAAVVVCGERLAERPVSRVVTPTAGTLTVVGAASCVAGVPEPRAPIELAHLIDALGTDVDGDVDVYLACGDEVVGLGGRATDGALTVTRASAALSRRDLAPVERWLAHPFATLDGRVFPAPTLSIPIAPDEADAALDASRVVEGARCTHEGDALACAGALPEVLARLYASFAAD